jgi:glycine cleavage system transcriptional repressor
MDGRRWFAVAAIGRDRPGIVADLSECVYSCDCNLEDASMTMLGSEFATLMLVSGVGPEIAETLASAFRRLEWERRLTVFLRPLEGAAIAADARSATNWRLEAEGVDKAGIVARISRCLANRQIRITDLRSRTLDGAEAGTPVYRLLMRILLPAELDAAPQPLERELAAVAEALRIEITLEPDR